MPRDVLDRSITVDPADFAPDSAATQARKQALIELFTAVRLFRVQSCLHNYSMKSRVLVTHHHSYLKIIPQQRLPIEHSPNDASLRILNCARIEPPYLSTSVICDNEVVLRRVREIVMRV